MKLELKSISAGYETPLISDGNALLIGGSLVALLGRNGAGKSTLLRHISGLLPLISGQVVIGGKSIHTLTERERAKMISFVTTWRGRAIQMTAREVVGLGRSPYTNRMGRLSKHDGRVVEEALIQVGIPHLADKFVSEISDGENQRVMIARALAQDTPVILLDEPTAFLDLPNRYELALLLRKLAHQRDKIILFSTHDLDVALQLCDILMLIDRHTLVTQATSEMRQSGYIEQLFSSDKVAIDPETGNVHLRKLG